MTWRLIRSGPMALWLLAGFLVLSAMDAYTTLVALDLGASEGNILMHPILEQGAVMFWFVKMGLALIAALILELAYLYRRITGFRVIAGVYLFQTIIVLNNLGVIWRLS